MSKAADADARVGSEDVTCKRGVGLDEREALEARLLRLVLMLLAAAPRATAFASIADCLARQRVGGNLRARLCDAANLTKQYHRQAHALVRLVPGM